MLQYLLNTTAIWLLSLVLFDVFLRRESFHRYNRFYLLFTFVLGALFPLVQWQGSSNRYPATLERPIERVITAKQTVIEATTPAVSISWSQWLFIAYLAGAAIVFILLLSEIIKLTAYYHSGKRSKQDGWTVVETGKEHAPFSFLNLLFVCSTERYNTEEWRMILNHEKRHHTLLHFADLLLLQLGRIVFWFHPLVYVYNKRLLLIHEYQADRATAAPPQVYGKFLVEQALLQSAPSISHSFNCSPIKKRIVMLTRRSSAASGIKMLVFIPLALVCVFCFSKNSFSQKFERNGNVVTYKGNTFELSTPLPNDTVTVIDPVTKQCEITIISHDQYPVKMNGREVFEENELITLPEFTGKEKTVWNYIFTPLQSEFDKLPDGKYYLNFINLIIDDKGQIVFFDAPVIEFRSIVPAELAVKINGKLESLLNANPKIKPAQLKGNSIIYRWSELGVRYIEVKDHKAVLLQ